MHSLEAEEWVDKIIADAEVDPRGKPDCYIVFKTRPQRNGPRDEIVGGPIAVFGSAKALRECFPLIVKQTDERWGLTGFSWWFDTRKDFK